MSMWDKYGNIDAKSLNEQASNLSDDFEEIPVGKYEVALDSLVLKESKAGDPMIAARFTVVNGTFQNRKVFLNQLVLKGDQNDAFRVHTCNVLLRSLESSLTDQVRFDGLQAYDQLINAIAGECTDAEYLLEITERKGYRNYKVLERFNSNAPTPVPVPAQYQPQAPSYPQNSQAPSYPQQGPQGYPQGGQFQQPQYPQQGGGNFGYNQ